MCRIGFGTMAEERRCWWSNNTGHGKQFVAAGAAIAPPRHNRLENRRYVLSFSHLPRDQGVRRAGLKALGQGFSEVRHGTAGRPSFTHLSTGAVPF
jgi:hypothetical protein